MKFRNKTSDRLDLPALGVSVDPGETFEAEGDQAKALLKQEDTFSRVDTPARQKAARSRKSDGSQVGGGAVEQGGVVAEATEPVVAGGAQDAPDGSGDVTVVDG